ncbi:MAG: DUF4302 domain-containing protein [Paludibacter sp.]|nr:DUF4302 domain-containing protein [Paludibacter sp.]
MKKSGFKIYMALLTLVSFMTACQQEEADIFSALPAERLNKAISDYYMMLTDVTNGWEMDYFANSTSPGYTLLVKFNKSGNAILASRSELTANKAYEKDSCLFDIIGDNGPVLTFNTFSKILHVFSNPENPDGYGLEGDYEFIILKASADTVWMKGKKYGAEVLLHKLPSNVQWKQFANDRYEFTSLLFSSKAPKLTLKIDKTIYNFYYGYTHVFAVEKSGKQLFEVPFIVTQDGIRFYEEIEIEGIKLKTFRINEAKTGFISIESPAYTLSGVDDLATFFTGDASSTWNFIPSNFSTPLGQQYQNIVQSVKSLYSADEVALSIKFNAIRRVFVLSVTYATGTNVTEGLLDLNINAVNKDMLTVSYKGTGDAKGLQFYNEVADLDDFLSAVSSAFALSTTAKINPGEIKFTKTTNPQVYFSIEPGN